MKILAALALGLSLASLPAALAALPSDTAAAGEQTTMEQDRAAILAGVKEIIAPGSLPGDVAAFSPHALVVITGRMGAARVPLLAAAHYGQGRAMVCGHESFFAGKSLDNPDNAQLARNMAAWAGEKPLDRLRVGLLNQDDALGRILSTAGCSVTVIQAADIPAALKPLDLLWLNQASLDGAGNETRVDALHKWVQDGRGVILTGPAWGWLSLHPGQDLVRDHSGNQVLAPMGLAFCAGTLDATGKTGFTTDEASLDLADAKNALAALSAQADGKRTLTPAEMEEVSTTLTEAVGAMPGGPGSLVEQVETLCAAHGENRIPTRQTPITTAMPLARLKARLDFERWRHLSPAEITADPSAASFPGPVPTDAPRLTRTINVDTSIPAWHGAGLYAAPGEVVTVTIPAAAIRKGLAIRIGAHTDTLWNLPRWERFPEITTRKPLDQVETSIASPFGGTLYVDVPDKCKLGTIPVTVAHAVAAPRFVRGMTGVDEWKQTLRNAPAPWAELEGKLVILTVPSSAVRNLDDPEALMAYWDTVMERCYQLFAAPRRSRPERYCVDRQISAGYMHSGYPVMTGDDVAKTFCDLKVLEGSDAIRVWGFYHEMGHNFQKPEWTWDGFGEVTNNLFSLYGTEKINGVMVGAHPAMTAAEMQKRVQVVAGAPGKQPYYRQDPWYPLTMFYLLRQAFGWEPFTRLFAEFRDLPDAARPRSDLEKRNQFLVRFSRLVGHNLTTYLSAWGVATSPAAQADVASLPSWMPADWPHA